MLSLGWYLLRFFVSLISFDLPLHHHPATYSSIQRWVMSFLLCFTVFPRMQKLLLVHYSAGYSASLFPRFVFPFAPFLLLLLLLFLHILINSCGLEKGWDEARVGPNINALLKSFLIVRSTLFNPVRYVISLKSVTRTLSFTYFVFLDPRAKNLFTDMISKYAT